MITIVEKKFNKLIGFEGSIIDLSNKLQELGCEDICEFKNWLEILEDGNVIVAIDKSGDNHIQIFFDITFTNSDDEVIEATNIKITNLDNY